MGRFLGVVLLLSGLCFLGAIHILCQPRGGVSVNLLFQRVERGLADFRFFCQGGRGFRHTLTFLTIDDVLLIRGTLRPGGG